MMIPFDGDAAKRFVRWLFMLDGDMINDDDVACSVRGEARDETARDERNQRVVKGERW